MNERTRQIVEGPILPVLARLAAPIIVLNLLQTAYELINLLWVGRLGPAAIGATTVAFPIIFLITAISFGLTIAGSAMIAQAAGAKHQALVDRIANQSVLIFTVTGAGLTAAGLALTGPLLRLMGTPAEVVPGAAAYLRIFFAGLVLVFGFFVFSALLRGIGDTTTPMYLMIVSTVVNAVLDPLLIYGLGPFPTMGVAGAALGTVVGRFAVTAYAAWMLLGGRWGIRLSLRGMRPDWDIIRRVFAIGLPSSVEMGIRAFELNLLTGIVARFGAVALAAYGIFNRLTSLVLMPSFAVSAATTTMVGQNLGARKPARAERSSRLAAGIMALALSGFGIVAFLWPLPFVRAFTADPGVATESVSLLRTVALTFGVLSGNIVLFGSLRGAGRTMAAAALSAVFSLVLRLPLALGLGVWLGRGTGGVWLAIALSNVLGAAVSLAYYLKSDWLEGSIIPDTPAQPLATSE